MNTKPTSAEEKAKHEAEKAAAANNAQQASNDRSGQKTSLVTPTPPPGTATVQQAPSPETARSPMHTSVPDPVAPSPGTAQSTHTDTPVATVAPSSPPPPQERDLSQGSPAKANQSTVHPVNGGQINEYSIPATELLYLADQKFGIDHRTGVTELRWDEAQQRMLVRHSPAPKQG